MHTQVTLVQVYRIEMRQERALKRQVMLRRCMSAAQRSAARTQQGQRSTPLL